MYLRHEDLSKYWVVDIEAPNLDPDEIYCVVFQNVATREVVKFWGDDLGRLRDFVLAHPDAYWIGHNAISFDVPVLNRIYDTGISLDRVIDTLVLSYLYNPRMPDGHSLGAWGHRLKIPKYDFHDFSQFTPEMLEYCVQDVWLTLNVFVKLTKRMLERGFSEKSCELEHQIRIVVDEQEQNGFYFDVGEATKLLNHLRQKADGLAGPIRELFPRELRNVGTYNYRLKADGQPYSSYFRHLERYPRVDLKGDSYDVYDWFDFNIASPKQRVDKLLSLGWKPQKFTPKTPSGGGGNPQVDEESLLDFHVKSGLPEVKAIADWLVLNGRANMVQTWLNAVGQDSRMHGRVFTCGAGTRRMTHNSPNTANIPKASKKVPYGHECRSLWTVADHTNRRLVGYDAKSLEMRMFAHYLDNAEAARLYIEGDPHQVNADMLGIERDPVKNVFYAFLYGAADPKLGWTGNTSLVSKKEQKAFGAWIRSQLIEKTPGLTELVQLIQAEGMWIRTIDGGFVQCEPEHARINYKLQSAGAIVMKQTSIFVRERIKERGLDARKVGDIHDEGQLDCAKGDAEEVGKLCVQAIRDAGEELNFRVPLDGDFKIGLSWAETH